MAHGEATSVDIFVCISLCTPLSLSVDFSSPWTSDGASSSEGVSVPALFFSLSLCLRRWESDRKEFFHESGRRQAKSKPPQPTAVLLPLLLRLCFFALCFVISSFRFLSRLFLAGPCASWCCSYQSAGLLLLFFFFFLLGRWRLVFCIKRKKEADRDLFERSEPRTVSRDGGPELRGRV